MRRFLILLFLIFEANLYSNSLVAQQISVEVEYLGLSLRFEVPSIFKASISYYVYEEFHEKYEKEISKVDISFFLLQLKALRNDHRIDDRFLFQVISRIAKQIAPDHNYQELMVWFISKKLGYTVAIGVKDGRYHFLPAYKEDLEGISFYTHEGTKYYLDNLIQDESGVGGLGVYPTIGKQKAFYLPYPLPDVPPIPNTRILNFNFKKIQYEIALQYDYAYVAMYYGLPGLEIPAYLNSRLSEVLKNSLHEQLDPIIRKLTKEDAVRFILVMIQNGMPYRTDGEQMGEEKYFLPDEFLHYHFSDCEDKSIFFTRVVQELLDIETRILQFDNHVAPVVHFNNLESHSSFTLSGMSFYYCETTGEGYELGQIPDQYKSYPVKEWK